MFNFAAALIIFASAINALVITTPGLNSRYAVGSSIPVLVSSTDVNDPTIVDLVISANGRTQTVVGFPVGTTQNVQLNSNLVGTTALTAAGVGATASTTFYIYPNYTPYYPCYNPCYNPYWGAYNPCYTPRNNCYRPVNNVPRCNIPRPRCRIRAADASESSDAVEFVLEESNPEILFSGFTVLVADNFEQEAQQQQEQSQSQEQQEQQVQQAVEQVAAEQQQA